MKKAASSKFMSSVTHVTPETVPRKCKPASSRNHVHEIATTCEFRAPTWADTAVPQPFGVAARASVSEGLFRQFCQKNGRGLDRHTVVERIPSDGRVLATTNVSTLDTR